MAGRKSISLSTYLKRHKKRISTKDRIDLYANQSKRNKEILIFKETGETFEQIGKRYGITKQRVRYIIMRAIKSV